MITNYNTMMKENGEKKAYVPGARCSSGIRFGSGKKEEAPKKVKDPVRVAFAQACPAYGLSPDFYGQGGLTESGEFWELVGFSGEFAKIRSLDEAEMLIPFPDAVAGMIRELKEELQDLPEKLILLEPSKEAAFAAKHAIRSRIACVQKALEVWNGSMEEIAGDMGIPYCSGWSGDGHLYEFVSYREELGERPYILENLDRLSNDTGRFKTVSFEQLCEGLKRYAEKTGDYRLLEALATAVPANRGKAEEAFEQSLFDFLNFV